MNKLKFKAAMRTVAVMTIFLMSSMAIITGASMMYPRACAGVDCDPTISVLNVSFFGNLLKKTAYNFLINQAKMAVLSKLNLEFLPGGFANILMGELVNVSDLSGKIENVLNGGLNSEIAYIRDQMSPEALRTTLNGAMEQTFQSSLGAVQDLTRSQVEQLVGEYRGQFLMAQQVFSTYSGAVGSYQTMMKDFVSDATNFTSAISNLGTKLDIASFVSGENGIGSIINTEAVMKEASVFMQNGIQNVVGITGYDIGIGVELNLAGMNANYLRSKLEGMTKEGTALITGTDGVVRETFGRVPLFTKEQVDKIIEDSNKAASASVADYLQKTSGALSQHASSVNSKLQNDLKGAVGQAEKVIENAVNVEKHKDFLAQKVSEEVQKSIGTIMGDAKEWFKIASDKELPTFPKAGADVGAGVADNVGKIAALIAGKNNSDLTRAHVKVWAIAKESADVVKNIRTKLGQYNPAMIDSKPEDAAWKDAARFQYYTLMLQNQQLKLLGAKAVAMAKNYEPYNEELKKYLKKEGLPAGY